MTRCADAEVRVAYHLYFQKDGWSNVLLARGHMHDWERVSILDGLFDFDERFWEGTRAGVKVGM